MKKLAIQGNKNNNVITLLVMLGGKNENLLNGDDSNCVYFIHHGIIDRINKQKLPSDYVVYTFEEFSKKHLFKIGDMVNIPEYESEVRINAMKWGINSESVLYMVYRVDEEEWYTTEELLDYNDIEDYKNIKSKNIKSNKEETITIDGFKANTKEWLIDKLESMSKDNALQAIYNIYDELHKSKYPKTYEECCKNVFELVHEGMTVDVPMHYSPLIINFTKLLICRDAYWKIAGEEMGLGKPWKPDISKDKYIIRRTANVVVKSYNISSVLEFPTPEIRNTFYDNFKDLIEKCKELL